MADIALGLAGATLATLGALGGGPAGAQLGFAIGMTLGGMLFPPSAGTVSSGKIAEVRVQNSSYDSPIPRLYGRGRLAGNVIWGKPPIETKKTTGGGKKPKVKSYTYYQHFAILICAGPMWRIRRIWADDEVIYDDRPEIGPLKTIKSVSADNIHIHLGGTSQSRDDLMVEIDGEDDTPAYRGRCYVTFERFNITRYGNRIPNMTFEIQSSAGDIYLDTVMGDLWDLVDGDPADVNFGPLSGVKCRGLAITNQTDLSPVYSSLEQAYTFDLTETGEELLPVLRGGSVAGTINSRHLGATTSTPTGSLVRLTRAQEVEIPTSVDVVYTSEGNDYQSMTVHAARQYGSGALKKTITMPVILSEQEATNLAVMAVHLGPVQRNAVAFALPWRYIWISPADLLTVPTPLGPLTVRVVEQTINLLGEIEILAVEEEVSLYSQDAPAPTANQGGGTTAENADTIFELFETTAAIDSLADSDMFYIGATGGGSPWPGASITVSPDLAILPSGTTEDVATVDSPAELGYADNAISAPAVWEVWDDVNYLDVEMYVGRPETRTDLDVLAGSNAIIAGHEIIQYATATSLGGGVYRLSRLLRGRRGSEWAMGSHVIGEPVLFLDLVDTVFVRVRSSEIGVTHTYRAHEIGAVDEIPPERDLALAGYARMPYSPVHLRGEWAGGDLAATWFRRARKDGGWMDGGDVPLDEATERYNVRVLGTGGPDPVYLVTAPSFVYTAAMQTTDFGAPQTEVDIDVRQIADDGREGFPATATL